MAFVDERTRGQLLLAGAFVLAVALIGLTLVFSASNYTTALASEGGGNSQGSDAVSIRENVRASLGAYLGTDPTKSQFRKTAAALGNGTRDLYGSRGRLVNVTVPPTVPIDPFTEGTQIELQKLAGGSGRSFTKPGTSDSDWDIAREIRARNITFVLDSNGVPTNAMDPLEIRFTDTVSPAPTWDINVYQIGSSPGERHVEVESSDGYFGECVRPATGEMSLNISRATVQGTHCSALDAIRPGTEYDLRIEGGDDAVGRFWLIVDTPGNPGMIPPYVTTGPGMGQKIVIYDVRVTFRYHSSRVAYITPLRIAPGEIR